MEIIEIRRAIETAVMERFVRPERRNRFWLKSCASSRRRGPLGIGMLCCFFLNADRAFHTFLAKLTKNRPLMEVQEDPGDMLQMKGRC
jgi:DNA-binding FadR family transcriptional regulator